VSGGVRLDAKLTVSLCKKKNVAMSKEMKTGQNILQKLLRRMWIEQVFSIGGDDV
jgi:hypothetical protein